MPHRVVNPLLRLLMLALLLNTIPAAPMLAQPQLTMTPNRSADTIPDPLPLASDPAPQPDTSPTSLHAHAQLPAAAARPLSFVPNNGQFDPSIQFQVHSLGGQLGFTADGVALAIATPSGSDHSSGRDRRAQNLDLRTPDAHATLAPAVSTIPVQLRFVGANPIPAIQPAEALPGVANYLIGNDPATWRTGVPTYAGIVYTQLYAGIDLRYDGAEGQLKGTYTVAPAADPARLVWRYTGATDLRLDSAGNLIITLPADPAAAASELAPTLIEHAPVAWQFVDGQRVPVTVAYQLSPDGRVSFVLGAYDASQPLTIDPTLTYSAYLGGSGNDYAYGVAVDAAGNAYITGYTQSSFGFPTTSGTIQPFFGGGGSDAFVSKISADGRTLLYSTYLGGNGDDNAYHIAVDSTGTAYLVGTTYSTNFPVANALQPSCGGAYCFDAFVARLSPDGRALPYSSYFGGYGGENGFGIATDGRGQVVISGGTGSGDLPRRNAWQASYGGGNSDAFVARIDTTLAGSAGLIFSTYLGGYNGSDRELAEGVALDAGGNAIVVGNTTAGNFPTRNALQSSYAGSVGGYGGDLFVTKFDPSGTASYSTYLGGNAGEWTYGGIAVDGDGNAYLTGDTSSFDFPTANAVQASAGPTCYGSGNVTYICNGDAFVTKLMDDGSGLVYSTFLGGTKGDSGHDIGVDSSGSAYVIGTTLSSDFPVAGALQATFGGVWDVFVTGFDPAGSSLRYST